MPTKREAASASARLDKAVVALQRSWQLLSFDYSANNRFRYLAAKLDYVIADGICQELLYDGLARRLEAVEVQLRSRQLLRGKHASALQGRPGQGRSRKKRAKRS